MAGENDLRAVMVERLQASGVLKTAEVVRALSAVPRHRFVPEVTSAVAYADQAVMVKYGSNGSPISSLSQPTIVAAMLELLEAEEGDRVLEVGTGTGYNAALLASVVRPTGSVISVEIEADLSARAVRTLDELGISHVRVVVGDGRDGWSAGAPYDRIIVTTGAPEVAQTWKEQLRAGARLVAPLVNEKGIGTIVAFDLEAERLVERGSTPCGFLPMRDRPSTPEA